MIFNSRIFKFLLDESLSSTTEFIYKNFSYLFDDALKSIETALNLLTIIKNQIIEMDEKHELIKKIDLACEKMHRTLEEKILACEKIREIQEEVKDIIQLIKNELTKNPNFIGLEDNITWEKIPHAFLKSGKEEIHGVKLNIFNDNNAQPSILVNTFSPN